MRLQSFLPFLLVASLLGSQPATAHAQAGCQNGRYLLPVFSCVQVNRDIRYGVGRYDWRSELLCSNGVLPPYTTLLPLFADVYEPCQDPDSSRAFILYIHGGAFAAGDKAAAQDAAICDSLARRGYVVASINYRLSLCGANALTLADQINRNPYELRRAAHRALQDAKAAVRFFKANADSFGIDTSRFFAAGVSAGAITTLGLAYLDKPSERYPEAQALPGLGFWLGNLLYPDLGSIEGEGGNPGVSSRVRAVAPVAGSLMDLSAMESALDPPALLVHGTADLTVPYDSGCFFQDLIAQGIVSRCHPTYGSAAVSRRADSLGLCHRFLSFAQAGHSLSALQVDTVIGEVAAFFHGLSCGGPAPVPVDTLVERCPGAPARLAVVPGSPGTRYFWFQNGMQLPGATHSLTLPAVSAGDFGGYLCLAEDPACHRALSDTLWLLPAIPTPAVLAPAGNPAFCQGDSLQVFGNAGPGMQYRWFRNGALLPGDTLRSLWVGQNGAYVLALTDSKGCQSFSDTLIVKVHPRPAVPVILASDSVLCPGDSLMLSAVGSGSKQWSTGDTSASIWVNKAGTYWVYATNDFQCSSPADTIGIASQPLPVAIFSFSLNGDTLYLQNRSLYAGSYHWDFGDGNTSSSVHPVHFFSQSGTYTVTLLAVNPCGKDSFSLPLTISITSLEDPGKDDRLGVYPNPGQGKLEIRLPGRRPLAAEVCDLQGRKLQRLWLEPGVNSVDLSHLPKGLYLLRCADALPVKLWLR